jgi:hypothetical protein
VPVPEKLVTPADLTRPIAGVLFDGVVETGMVSEELAVTHGPLGGVPLTVPVLEMLPALTSACVVV